MEHLRKTCVDVATKNSNNRTSDSSMTAAESIYWWTKWIVFAKRVTHLWEELWNILLSFSFCVGLVNDLWFWARESAFHIVCCAVCALTRHVLWMLMTIIMKIGMHRIVFKFARLLGQAESIRRTNEYIWWMHLPMIQFTSWSLNPICSCATWALKRKCLSRWMQGERSWRNN